MSLTPQLADDWTMARGQYLPAGGAGRSQPGVTN